MNTGPFRVVAHGRRWRVSGPGLPLKGRPSFSTKEGAAQHALSCFACWQAEHEWPNNTCPKCGASRGNGHADDCSTRNVAAPPQEGQ